MGRLTSEETLRQAVRSALRELAAYVEPGLRDAHATIERLLEILDTEEVAAALEAETKKPAG